MRVSSVSMWLSVTSAWGMGCRMVLTAFSRLYLDAPDDFNDAVSCFCLPQTLSVCTADPRLLQAGWSSRSGSVCPFVLLD